MLILPICCYAPHDAPHTHPVAEPRELTDPGLLLPPTHPLFKTDIRQSHMLRSTLTTLPILRTAALRSPASCALAIRSKSAVEGVKDAARSVSLSLSYAYLWPARF